MRGIALFVAGLVCGIVMMQQGSAQGTKGKGRRLNHVGVNAKNYQETLDFYTKKLGLRVFTDQTMGDSRWIELQVPGAETLVVLFKDANHKPATQAPAAVFVADNVQTTYEELKAKGVEFQQPPKKEHWGEHAILKDSEGNLVLIGN